MLAAHSCREASKKCMYSHDLGTTAGSFLYLLLKFSANFVPNACYCRDSEREANTTKQIDELDQIAKGEVGGKSHLYMTL